MIVEHSKNYYVSSHSYLARAKECLEEFNHKYLFYGALELRCCIEARQDEYLEAQARYRLSAKQNWQIGKKAKELNKIFSQEKISKITIFPNESPCFTVYHIPVGKKLVKSSHELGKYLHAMPAFKKESDTWWGDRRQYLIGVYRDIWTCCKGTLLCPPLISQDGTSGLTLEFDRSSEVKARETADLLAQGKRVIMQVDYPKEPPSDWVCDL